MVLYRVLHVLQVGSVLLVFELEQELCHRDFTHPQPRILGEERKTRQRCLPWHPSANLSRHRKARAVLHLEQGSPHIVGLLHLSFKGYHHDDGAPLIILKPLAVVQYVRHVTIFCEALGAKSLGAPCCVEDLPKG